MSQSEEPTDLDQQFSALSDKAGEFLEKVQFRSALRVYGEMHRLAKGEQRVIPYMRALFHQMDLSKDMLEPQIARENAVTLIGLLESPERAMLMQPEFPEAEYEHSQAWMSSCAYENLAEATGMVEGYNSEGMHGCINDGMQVCRRTGKLACISCFREYATDVYSAAEDIAMALHHCRSIYNQQGGWSDRGDRRWFAARNAAWLLTLVGQVDAAEATLSKGQEFSTAEKVSLPLQAKLRLETDWEAFKLITGKQDPTASAPPRALATDENPFFDMRWAMCDALRLSCRGEHSAAREILIPWDRLLTQRKCVSEWFEVRLRLIATHRLAGDTRTADALAKPLDERARKARDWLTLRRLQRLLDPAESPSPLALLVPLPAGPFAAPPSETIAAPVAAPEQPVVEPSAAPASPLDEQVQAFIARLESAGEDEAARAALAADVLAVPTERITHSFDAARLIHICLYLSDDKVRGPALWRWVEAVAKPFPQDATVSNLLATLGDQLLSHPETQIADLVSHEQVERLFRLSLDQDVDHARNFARAGSFFLSRDNLDSAEHCLARGFRLERDNSYLALRLSEVYERTERPRDALAVLDLCLRSGNADPEVSWNAIIAAYQVGQYESLLIYTDRHEELAPGQPWVNYYRAVGLLEQNQPEAALAALDEEERRSTERPFPIAILRACANADLERSDACREQIAKVLATRLADVDYLTITGLTNLTQRLWQAAADWPADDAVRSRLAGLLLATGLAPEDLFEEVRDQGEVCEGINFYRCTVLQPLDESWPRFPGCLAGQEDWPDYRIHWGVLARDEDEAARIVLDWQARCYPVPAEVEAVELDDDGFRDKPGVIWQGFRWHDEEAEGE